NFKFQVAINTHAWDRVGVFFGYRTPQTDPGIPAKDFAHLQYIAFERQGLSQNSVMRRGRTILQPRGDGRPLLARATPMTTASLSEKAGERVLEISVTEQDLVRVYLDNVELTTLREIGPGYVIPNEDFRGVFGVFTHNNSCNFRDAKVYLSASS